MLGKQGNVVFHLETLADRRKIITESLVKETLTARWPCYVFKSRLTSRKKYKVT